MVELQPAIVRVHSMAGPHSKSIGGGLPSDGASESSVVTGPVSLIVRHECKLFRFSCDLIDGNGREAGFAAIDHSYYNEVSVP